jgi:ribonuclease VapC
VAILQNEPERRTFNKLIEAAETCVISTANFVEVSIVVEARYGADGIRDLDLFLSKAGINQMSVDEEQAHLARIAFRRYGEGRHPAGLTFGDCFAYALAQSLGEPLLFKGEDFSGTDMEPAAA